MSEVIDELVVTLGLDARKFVAGQKQSADSMKKTQEELTKRAKLMEESGKGVTNTIMSISREFLALGATIVGSVGLKQFVEQMSAANVELSNFAATLNTSPQFVWGLDAAIKELSNSSGEGGKLLGALNKQIKDAQLNGGRLPQSLTSLAAMVGMKLDQNHGPVEYLKSLSAAAKALADKGPQAKSTASALLDMGGFDTAQITAMEKYGAAIVDIGKDRAKLGPSPESIASSKEFVDLWTKFGEEMGRLYNDTLPHLLGPIDGLLRSVNSALDRLNAYNRGDAPSAAKSSLMHPGRDGSILFGHDPDVMANPDIPDPGDLYRLDRRIHGERATGGQVDAGKRYLVGERGPELFTPGSYGGITPNSALGGGIEVDGRPISRGNPMPVTLTGRDGSGPQSLWDLIFGTDTSSSAGGGGGGSSVVASLGNAFRNLMHGGASGGAGGAMPSLGDTPLSSNSRATGGWWTKDRMQYAVDRLVKEAGLTPMGASGLVARWAGIEASGGPSSRNNIGGGHWGIGQWDRNRGGPAIGAASYEDQISHAISELNSSEKRAGDALRNATTYADAARGASMFERAEHYNPSTGVDDWTLKTPVDKVWHALYGGSGSAGDVGFGVVPPGGRSNFSGANPYWNLAPRRGYHWDSVQQLQIPTDGGDFGFHNDYRSRGIPSALSLSSLGSRQNVTSSSTSNALHVGRIDVNAPRAQNAQEIGAGISDALRNNLFAMLAQSGQV